MTWNLVRQELEEPPRVGALEDSSMRKTVRRRSWRCVTCLVSLSCVLRFCESASKYIEDPESFPGWKGELPGTSMDASPQHSAPAETRDSAKKHMVSSELLSSRPVSVMLNLAFSVVRNRRR